MAHDPVQTLLRRVSQRMWWSTWGSRAFQALCVWAGVYAVALLATRLLGFFPDGIGWPVWAAVPGLALVTALLFVRRPAPLVAARAIDQNLGSHDLFLTAVLLEKSPGEFKPIVTQQAAETATKVPPASVIRFEPKFIAQRLALCGLIWGLLALGTWGLPQLDPFGQVAQAQEVEKIKKELAEAKKATELRKSLLKKESEEQEAADTVDRALEKLQESFKKLAPLKKEENRTELAQHQQPLGQLWKKLNSEKLQQALAKPVDSQALGNEEDKEMLQKFQKELQEGHTDSLQKELSKIEEELQKLVKQEKEGGASDPAEQQEQLQKLRKKLEDLQDFAEKQAGQKELAAALQRAVDEVKMCKNCENKGLSSEALEAAQQSLELAKMELQELAQSAEDLQKLEQALKTLQMAKKLNEGEQLDGEACEKCQGAGSMKAYEELYQQLLAQLGDGEGSEMEGEGAFKGRGRGKGGKAPEDDSEATDFKTEQSTSPVTAGKVLLTLKGKGLSDNGEALQDYNDAIQEVKQGASQAILQEQIPPGYHESIKQYFDSLEKKAAKTKK